MEFPKELPSPQPLPQVTAQQSGEPKLSDNEFSLAEQAFLALKEPPIVLKDTLPASSAKAAEGMKKVEENTKKMVQVAFGSSRRRRAINASSGQSKHPVGNKTTELNISSPKQVAQEGSKKATIDKTELMRMFDQLENRSKSKIFGDRYERWVKTPFQKYLAATTDTARFEAGEELRRVIKTYQEDRQRRGLGHNVKDQQLKKLVEHLDAQYSKKIQSDLQEKIKIFNASSTRTSKTAGSIIKGIDTVISKAQTRPDFFGKALSDLWRGVERITIKDKGVTTFDGSKFTGKKNTEGTKAFIGVLAKDHVSGEQPDRFKAEVDKQSWENNQQATAFGEQQHPGLVAEKDYQRLLALMAIQSQEVYGQMMLPLQQQFGSYAEKGEPPLFLKEDKGSRQIEQEIHPDGSLTYHYRIEYDVMLKGGAEENQNLVVGKAQIHAVVEFDKDLSHCTGVKQLEISNVRMADEAVLKTGVGRR